jgi:hypothetical protein
MFARPCTIPHIVWRTSYRCPVVLNLPSLLMDPTCDYLIGITYDILVGSVWTSYEPMVRTPQYAIVSFPALSPESSFEVLLAVSYLCHCNLSSYAQISSDFLMYEICSSHIYPWINPLPFSLHALTINETSTQFAHTKGSSTPWNLLVLVTVPQRAFPSWSHMTAPASRRNLLNVLAALPTRRSILSSSE